MKQSAINGRQLMLWRESQGWQRSWLAEKIGISPSALWKWESAEFVPLIAERACAAVKAGLPMICETTPTKGE